MTNRYEYKDKIEVLTANYPLSQDVFKQASDESRPLLVHEEA
jgi:hypothetical protein